MSHEFKPYTDQPDLCQAEIPESGDTCNQPIEEHEGMSVMSELDIEMRAKVKEIRDIQAEYVAWTEENEDLAGNDDESWYDTIAWYDGKLANAGQELAGLVEKLIGDEA